jgi:hypothetical protein
MNNEKLKNIFGGPTMGSENPNGNSNLILIIAIATICLGTCAYLYYRSSKSIHKNKNDK